ncbi:NAD-binding Rossmann fold oxidoreductase [Panus rudis PR-1116 ss-1]|nr:NAD-binding Rossmann fold oxidoreductase [Panus rudis PR-1116 ss-1]
MAPIRLGVIGLSTRGWASRALIPPIFDPLLSSKYQLTALCTTNPTSAQEAARKYSELAGSKVKGYYGDEGAVALAQDPDVDMVVISVNIPEHLKVALPAIEAGKDISIEWTPGKGYQETLQIAEAVKRKGVRCLVGTQAVQGLYVKKVRELITAGKIGRVLSSTIQLTAAHADLGMWGPIAYDGTRYLMDAKNHATPLTITAGHLLAAVTDVLGDFAEVVADATIRIDPNVQILNIDNKPTGEVIQKTVPDQYGIVGKLKDGIFVTVHVQVGLRAEQAKGRRLFHWIIDGEEGSIEVQGLPEHGSLAFSPNIEKKVLLNGVEVPLEESEVDKLGYTGKAWLEFAKEDGNYPTIDDAVKLHRTIDAIERSIEEGRKVKLI